MLEIIIALVAAVLVGLGLSFQRIGLKKNKFSLRMLKSKNWMFGSALATIAFILYYYALGIGKLSIIQPIINISIVFAAVFGYFFLKEKSSSKELLLILIIFLGVVLIAV